jgi:hypothetical protein
LGDRPLSARDMRQSVIVTGDGNTVMLILRRQGPHLAAIAGKLLPHLPRGSDPPGTACSRWLDYPCEGLEPIPDYFPVSPNKFPVGSNKFPVPSHGN